MPSDSTSDATSKTPADTPSPVSRARRVAGRAPGGATAPPNTNPSKPGSSKQGSAPKTAASKSSASKTAAPKTAAPKTAAPKTAAPKTAAPKTAESAPSARRRPSVVTAERVDRPSVAWDGDEAKAAAAAPATTSKAGRNLPAAIAVGLALGALIIASLFLWRPAFAFVAGAAVLYGCYELSRALATAGIRITLLPLLVGSVAMFLAAWQRGPSGLVLGTLVTVLGVVVWRLGDGAEGYGRDIGASSLVVLYLPLLAGFAVLLSHPHDGAARVIAFIVTVVCSDTGGYATGVLFGKHPLAPVISKGKTWEGFAGSVLACSGSGVLFMVFTFHHEWWKGLLFGLAVVVTATLGDLGESMIKRDVGIKDMGSLLPGHGGVMDRLDSLLPCAAVAYLILSGFAPV